MLLALLLGFWVIMLFITHRMSTELDNQIKVMALDFLENNRLFDVSDMKSSAVYSIVYRMLPHVFILALILGAPDKGFFMVLCMLYLGFQILKAIVQLLVLTKLSSQIFAEKVIEGFKGAK